MQRTKRIIWGVVLITVGVVMSLDFCNLIDFDFFFKGWWTLFLIVPSLVGLLTDRDKLGALIGLLLGAGLLLSVNDLITFDLFLKLFGCAVIILIGLKLVFGGMFVGKHGKARRKLEEKLNGKRPEASGEVKEYCATFSALRPDLDGQIVYGAELTAVFGRVEFDLRGAELPEDAVIKVCAVFGSVAVLLPDNVNVHVSVSPVFGGVSDGKIQTREVKDEQKTVYIDGNAIFGGVDIQ